MPRINKYGEIERDASSPSNRNSGTPSVGGRDNSGLSIGSILTFLLLAAVGFFAAGVTIGFVTNIVGSALGYNVLLISGTAIITIWLINKLLGLIVKSRAGRTGFALGSVGLLLWIFVLFANIFAK